MSLKYASNGDKHKGGLVGQKIEIIWLVFFFPSPTSGAIDIIYLIHKSFTYLNTFSINSRDLNSFLLLFFDNDIVSSSSFV